MNAHLIIILLLGLITSYEDLKDGKVRNKWLLVFSGFCALLLIVEWIGGHKPDFKNEVFYISINSLCAFLTGYAVWKARIWPPGDAKLYAAYAFIIPLEFYEKGYLPYFPAFALIINIFIVALVYMLLHLSIILLSSTYAMEVPLSKRLGLRLGEALGKWPEYFWAIAGVMPIFFFFQIVGKFVTAYVQGFGRYYVVLYYIFLLYIFPRALRLTSGKARYLLAILAAAFLLLSISCDVFVFGKPLFAAAVNAKNAIESYMIMFIVYAAGRRIFSEYLKGTEENVVKVFYLSRKSVLTDESKKRVLEKIPDIGDFLSQGLTEEQIGRIKKNFDPNDIMLLYRTISFAPIVFLGVLVTIAIRQSLVHLYFHGL